jgi:hypothetical protein
MVPFWVLELILCNASYSPKIGTNVVSRSVRLTAVHWYWGTLMARIQRRQHSRKEQRLEARVAPEQKRPIERALLLPEMVLHDLGSGSV